jgi:hypothetical protein
MIYTLILCANFVLMLALASTMHAPVFPVVAAVLIHGFLFGGMYLESSDHSGAR